MFSSVPHDEVVDADHALPALEERLAEMGAEEAGASGDESGGHCLIVLGRLLRSFYDGASRAPTSS